MKNVIKHKKEPVLKGLALFLCPALGWMRDTATSQSLATIRSYTGSFKSITFQILKVKFCKF